MKIKQPFFCYWILLNLSNNFYPYKSIYYESLLLRNVSVIPIINRGVITKSYYWILNMDKKRLTNKKQNLNMSDDLAVYPYPIDEFDKIIRVDFSQTNFSNSKKEQKKKESDESLGSLSGNSNKMNTSNPVLVKDDIDNFEHDLAQKIVLSTQADFNLFMTNVLKQPIVVGVEFKKLNKTDSLKAEDLEEQLTLFITHNYSLQEETISGLLKLKIILNKINEIENLVHLLDNNFSQEQLYLLAFSSYLSKHNSEAMAFINRISNLGYKELYLRGVVYFSLNNIEVATKDFKRVFSAFSADISFLELAVVIFRKQGEQNYLIKCLKKLFSLQPDVSTYGYELIGLLFEQDKFLEIVAYIKKLVVVTGSISAENQYRLGIAYGMLGLHDAALGCFKSILSLENISYLDALYKIQNIQLADSKVVLLLVSYFFFQEKYDECLDYISNQNKEVIDRIALLAGQCYIFKEDFDKADKMLQQENILLESLLPEFNYLRGVLQWSLGEKEIAEESFKLAENMGFLGKKLYFYRAVIATEHEQYLEALNFYKQSLNSGYISISVYRGLALVATKLKMYNVALSAFKDLKNISSDDLKVENAMGILYAKLGDYKKSVASFKAVLKLDQYHKEAHWNLSLVYKLILEGNAKKHLKRFTEIDKIGDGDFFG